MRREMSSEEVARRFHQSYERLAPFYGYETRKASAKPWSEVPENNRDLMIATVEDLRRRHVIRAPKTDRAERRKVQAAIAELRRGAYQKARANGCGRLHGWIYAWSHTREVR